MLFTCTLVRSRSFTMQPLPYKYVTLHWVLLQETPIMQIYQCFIYTDVCTFSSKTPWMYLLYFLTPRRREQVFSLFRCIVSIRMTKITLVTLGRLADVSLNKNGGSREEVENKGSVWVEGERIKIPFLTRKMITQKLNHSRNEFSLHLVFFIDIWDLKSSELGPTESRGDIIGGLLLDPLRLTVTSPAASWSYLLPEN